jgi:UDP-glucose 4-epimerase
MRILVTGGAGFIGSHIVEHALDAGHEVVALDDLSSGKRENLPRGVHLYEVDIRNREETLRAFADFRPDSVSHQAAQASVTVSMKDPAFDAAVNVIGSLHVAEAALQVGATKFVFASTGGAIYGNIATGAASENHPTQPISPYAIHKLAFEQLLSVYARERDLEPVILRYANVYGPRQDPHGEAGVVAIFFNRALKNEPIQINAMRSPGDDGCLRDYVYVRDVARANLQAIQGDLSAPILQGVPTLNLGTGVATHTRALGEAIRRLSGSSSLLTQGAPRVGDVERSVLDGAFAHKSLGPFFNLEAGLEKTAAWFTKAP